MDKTPLYDVSSLDIALVESLLNSSITAYEIEKQTGVSRNTITRVRRGEAKFANMTIGSLVLLAKYAEHNRKKIKCKNV